MCFKYQIYSILQVKDLLLTTRLSSEDNVLSCSQRERFVFWGNIPLKTADSFLVRYETVNIVQQ